MSLLDEDGLWFALHKEGDELDRFPAERSEARGALAGKLTLQL